MRGEAGGWWFWLPTGTVGLSVPLSTLPQPAASASAPSSLLGWLSYSVPRNPGLHKAWVLSRQVTETLIPAFLFIPDTPAPPPPTTTVSVEPLPLPVPSRHLSQALEKDTHPTWLTSGLQLGVAAVPWLGRGGVRDGGGHETGQCLLVPLPPAWGASPQHLVLGCLPAWLPSSWPSCSNMQEFQERLRGCQDPAWH